MESVPVIWISGLLLGILVTFGKCADIEVVQVGLFSTPLKVPCVYHVRPEDITAGQWLKSSQPDVFEGAKVVAWRRDQTFQGYYGFNITEDYSLIAHGITQTDEAVYRCQITPKGDAEESTYDIKLVAYAIPSKLPVIEHTQQRDGIEVKCSVSNVYPLAYPSLSSAKGDPSSVENEDGTYNTTISYMFPRSMLSDENMTVECYYSNINYTSSASLRLYHAKVYPTPDVDEFCSNFSCTNTNNRHVRSGLFIVATFFILAVLCSVSIFMAMKEQLNSHCTAYEKNRRNREENGIPDGKSKWIVLLGKYIYFVLTFVIQITVMILLTVFLNILLKIK